MSWQTSNPIALSRMGAIEERVLMKQIILLFLIISSSILPTRVVSEKYGTLAQEIKKIIDTHPDTHIGCEIYSLKNNCPVLAHNANQLFTPASNTKLFSSVLALELLGQDFRFKTSLVTDGKRHKNELVGNVYIQGSGDPMLTRHDLARLIKNLADRKITKIVGDFCIDLTLYDQEYFAPGSSIDDLGASWNNPVCSLMVDRKPLGINVAPYISFMDRTRIKSMFFPGNQFIKQVLAKYGIELTGSITQKIVPQKYVHLKHHLSPPLFDLLNKVLKDSDNLIADCLFKKAGACYCNASGNWQNAADAQKQWIKKNKILPTSDYVIKDGSGRSRYNLIAPGHIISLLKWVHRQSYFDTFCKSLAIAGVDGRLKNRMTSNAPRIYAKTGTLSGVTGLSGYIRTDHDQFAFSILINGFTQDMGTIRSTVEDAICNELATNVDRQNIANLGK